MVNDNSKRAADVAEPVAARLRSRKNYRGMLARDLLSQSRILRNGAAKIAVYEALSGVEQMLRCHFDRT